MAFGENQLAELDPVTRSQGAAAVKRSIAVFEKGLIVSYAVGIRGEQAVTVTVSDTVTANWDIGQVGFHPDHEPDSGDATQSGIRFTVDVTPDDFRILKLGVRPAPDKPPEELESDQSFSPPTIDNAEIVEADQDGPESTLIDGPSDGESAIEDPSALSSNGGQSAPQSAADADAEPADTPQATEPADDDSILASDDPMADVGTISADDTPQGVDPEDATSVSDLFGKFDGEATADNASGGGPSRGRNPDDDPEASVSTPEEPIGTPTGDEPSVGNPPEDPTTDSTAAPTQSPTDAVLPQLLDELGELSPDHRDRLGDHLSGIIGAESAVEESTTARVQELESRVDEFAAYTDALGELLDQEEPAALLDDVQAELDSLRQEVGALQQDVKEVHDRQNTIEVRIESIISDLEHLIGTQQSVK